MLSDAWKSWTPDINVNCLIMFSVLELWPCLGSKPVLFPGRVLLDETPPR